MDKCIYRKSALTFVLIVFFFVLFAPRTGRSEWKGDIRVNVDSAGKQACRGADCPWSISVDNNDRVHVVWEDRRLGYPVRIYYRGKDPDPTWMKWDHSDYELSTIDSVVIFGHPSIFAQPDGKIFSVYVEERAFGGELYGSWITDHPSKHIESGLVSSAGGNYLTFSSAGWQTTIAVSGSRSITFWPYVNFESEESLPIYYRIYEKNVPLTSERPIILGEKGLEYRGVHLSASAGSGNKVYLVCRLINGDSPKGHIFLLTLNLKNGDLIGIEDLTPYETRYCLFPYIAVMPGSDGNDTLYVVYEISDMNSKAAFISNYSGTWSDPRILSAGDKTSGHPCLAVNGKYADFVYEAPNNTPNAQIYHQRYDPSTDVLTEAARVTNSGDYYSMRPVMASDSYGNLHLIYITNRENPDLYGDEEVYYSIYDAPPMAPDGLEYDKEDNIITWRANREPDISRYKIDFNGRDTVVYDNMLDIEQFSFDQFVVSVRAVDLSGQESAPVIWRSTYGGVREIAYAPKNLIVGINYPNPFNASTRIPLSAKNMTYPLYLEIFDIAGKIVKTFVINNADKREIVWDAKNDYAGYVSTGVYFYRLRSRTEFGNTEMMTLIK